MMETGSRFTHILEKGSHCALGIYNSKCKSDGYQKVLVVAINICQCCLAMNHI